MVTDDSCQGKMSEVLYMDDSDCPLLRAATTPWSLIVGAGYEVASFKHPTQTLLKWTFSKAISVAYISIRGSGNTSYTINLYSLFTVIRWAHIIRVSGVVYHSLSCRYFLFGGNFREDKFMASPVDKAYEGRQYSYKTGLNWNLRQMSTKLACPSFRMFFLQMACNRRRDI